MMEQYIFIYLGTGHFIFHAPSYEHRRRQRDILQFHATFHLQLKFKSELKSHLTGVMKVKVALSLDGEGESEFFVNSSSLTRAHVIQCSQFYTICTVNGVSRDIQRYTGGPI